MATRSSKEASRCNVFVRSRPLSENNKGSKSILSFPSFKELTVKDAKQETTYRFDRVFPTNADNTQVCDEVCQPLIEAFLGGCNSCFMVYGQTGSGKTHTILSDNGLVPQTIERVIKIINEDSKYVYNLIFSYLQIYQDKIYDLLVNAGTGPLKLREHPKEGIVVEGLSEFEIKTREKAHELLEQGRKKLIVAETNMVRSSSRSHALCMLKIEKTKIESVNEYPSEEIETVTDLSGAETLECLKGKLYLCDLAGSERLKKTHVSGKRLVEARYINTSLLELGNVIHALAARNNPHIPFRNSKLTRLLKESLGGNSKASLMICVSPSIKDLKETKCSLNFGQRAMKVIKYSVPNVQVDYKALSEFLSLKLKELESAYRMERDNLRELKSKYRRSSKEASIDSSGESSPAHKQHLTTLIEETADLLSNSSIFHELSANELNEQMLIESNVHTFDHPDFLSTLSTPDTAVKIMDTIYPDRNNDWFRQWPNSQAFLQPVSPNDNTTIEHRDSGIQTDAEEDISPNFENLPLCETDTSYDIKTKMEFSKEIKEMGIQTDIPHSSDVHINIESIGTQYSNENVNLAAAVTEKAINTCHFLELKEQNPSQGSTNQFLVSNTNCVVENSFSESPSAIAMSSNEIPAAVVMSTNESHSAIAMSSTESPSAIAMSSTESPSAIAMSANESHSAIAMTTNESHSAIAMSTNESHSAIAMSSTESHSAIAMSTNESPSAIAMSSTEIPAAIAMSSNESHSAIAMTTTANPSAIAMSSNENESSDDTTEHLQQQTKISDLLINNKMLNEQPIIFPAADKPTEKISNFNSKNFNSNLVDNTSSQLHQKADGNLTRQTLLKNVDALQENISHKNKSDFSFEKQSTDQSILENDKIYNNKNKNSESQDNIRNEIKNDELFETYSNKSDNVQSEEDVNLVDDKSKPSYSECHTMCSNIQSNVHTNVEVDVEEGEGFIKEVVFSGITNKLKEDSNYKEMKPIDLEKQIDKHVGALTGNDSLEICNTKVGSQHQQISPNKSKDSKHVKPESKSSVEPSSHVQTLLPDSKAILSKTTYVPLLLHESIECFCDESSEQANTDNVDTISKSDSNVEEVPVDINEDLESSADNIDSIETDQKTLISSTVESFPSTTTAEDFKSHSPFKRRSVDESKFQLATRDPIAQLPESVETIVNKTAEGLKLGRHRKSKSLASIELVKNRSHENAGSMSSPASPQWKNNDTLTFGTFLRNKTSDLLEKLPSRKKSRESPRPVKKDVEEEMVGEAERSNKATATAQSKNSKECQGQLADTIFQDIHNLLLSPSKRKYSEPRLQTESSTQNSMKYETPERREIDHEDFKCRSSSGKEIMKFHENTEELQPEVRDSTNNMKQKLESMNDPYGFEIDETIQMQNAEGDNKDLEDNDNVLEEKIFSDFYLDEITKAPFNPSSPYFRKLEVVNGNNSTIEKPFSEGNDITQLSETFQKRDQAITCVKKDSYEPPIETYFNYLQNEIREELGKETSPNTLQTYIKADSCEVHSGDLNVKEASILRYSYASVDTSYDEYNSSTDGYMSSISTTSSYRRCSSADSETEYRMFKDTERAKKSLHKVKQKYEKILRQFEEVMEDKSLIEDELNTSRSCYDLVLKFKTELEVELQKAREQLQILKPDQEESADSYEHRRVSDSDETIAGDVDPFSEVDESFLSVDEHMEEIRNLPTMYFQTNSDSDNNSPSQSMGTSTPISQSKLNQFPSPNKRLDTLASSGPGLWFQKSFSKLSKEKAKRKEKLTLAAIENTEIKKELLLTKLEKNRLEAVLSCIMAESRDQPGLGMMRNLASSRSTVSSSCSNLPLGMSPNTYQPSPFRKYNFKDRFLAGADSSASTTPFARKKDTSTETSMFSLLSPDSSLSDFDISSMSDITSPSLLTRMSPYGEAIPEESIADNESQDMDELVRDMNYQDEQIPAGCLPFLKMRSARKKRKLKEKKKKAKIR